MKSPAESKGLLANVLPASPRIRLAPEPRLLYSYATQRRFGRRPRPALVGHRDNGRRQEFFSEPGFILPIRPKSVRQGCSESIWSHELSDG